MPIENEPVERPKSIPTFPQVVFCVICLYVVASAVSSWLAQQSEYAEQYQTVSTVSMFVVFVALAVVFSLWFLSCFSGEEKLSPGRTARMFYFAYTFTITSFVVLMIPIANPWQPDIIGPMSLIRGCVLGPVSNEESVPGAVRCSRSEVLFLSQRDGVHYAGNLSAHEVAQGAGDSSVGATKSEKLSGLLSCSQVGEGQRCVEKYSYPWLITLGGFNGLTVGTRTAHQSAQDATAAASAKVREAANAHEAGSMKVAAVANIEMDHERISVIQGGFVVPFYVILLAFIGGAVSLTRRIPEYQKRAEEGYLPTTRQPALTEVEVREVVVFQIMQLMSSPFIAVVAFYALAPASMAAAIGQAFLSGFSSELILLQVRGVVEGLQPHVTAFNNPVNLAQTDKQAASQVVPDAQPVTPVGSTGTQSDSSRGRAPDDGPLSTA